MMVRADAVPRQRDSFRMQQRKLWLATQFATFLAFWVKKKLQLAQQHPRIGACLIWQSVFQDGG